MFAKVLDDSQIKLIRNASLSVLERTGVSIPHKDMLKRLSDLGARVDFERNLVRIPPELVEKSVAQAGKSYTLYGRDLKKMAEFGTGKRNYNSIAGEAHWIDRPGRQRRFASLDDVATAARFNDALDSITISGSMSDPHELPVSWRCVQVMATMLRNTTKPITFWYHDRKSAKFINEIITLLRGSTADAEKYPICYPFLEPISPLSFPYNGIDLLYETSKLNLPVPIGPMAQMGVSAPMSIPGTMVIENSEILAGICITQAVRPGLPVCYGGICHAFDMMTTQMIFGGPEQAIFGTAMTQIGKSYGLPVYINVGLSDSKRPDAQASLEAAVSLAYGAAAGADIFGHMGISGVDQASSLDMLVLQNEIISFVESTMRKLDFSDDAFALDLIDRLGPGGSFIDTDNTFERFRSELWTSNLLDRNYYQAWLDSGAKSTEERCYELKNKILAEHKPEPISTSLSAEIDRIVAAAQMELGEAG